MVRNSRHNTSLPIKDILSEIMGQPVIRKGINETRAIKAWEAVLGPSVMRITTNIYTKNGILFVNLNSSVIRNELFLNKTKIIDSINEYIGTKTINDIVLR